MSQSSRRIPFREAERALRGLMLLAVVVPLAGCDEPRKDIIGSEKKLYSQHDEELVIRDFFQDRREGFFVDVGCAWAERNSTTYYLEKHLGWSGIGVDALAEYGDEWKQKRPRSRFRSFLVTDHIKEDEAFYRAAWTGVSSYRKEEVEQWVGDDYTEIKVPAITLDKLLELEGVEQIDFLSMDIEGAQLSALRGFDIEKYHPGLVCIEAHEPDREAIFAFFQEHGYEQLEHYAAYESVNWYFAPRAR